MFSEEDLITSDESVTDISDKLATMSTENKKLKKKRNSFVEVNGPVDISMKKKKGSVTDEMKSKQTHQINTLFPVNNKWDEDNVKKTNTSNTGKHGTMNLFDKKKSNFSYYLESNRSALLRCCANTVINFNGVLNIKVLQGSIRIAGYTVTKHEPRPTKVYSLNAYNYLPIELLKSERDKVKKNKLTKALRELSVSQDNISAIMEYLQPEECLLHILCASECFTPDKVLFHMIHRLNVSIPHLLPDKSYFRQSEDPADLLEIHLKTRFFKVINSTIGAPVLVAPNQWSQLFEQCVQPNQKARLVLCGGSGVGKTTLLRYLINRTIQEFGKALVIDLDPGQAEFFLPGTLSATVVDAPLLGPNFVHILNRDRLPEKCYFLGDVKPHANSHHYVKHVTALLDHCHAERSLGSMPWFVNTMGYVRDQGVSLNCRIIHETKPTHVIQIQGRKAEDNFPDDLVPSFVRRNMYSSHEEKKAGLGEPAAFELVQIESVKNKPFDNMNKSLKPGDKRKIVLIAYWSSMYSDIKPEYSVNQLTPYGCQLRHLGVDVTNGGQLRRHEILAAMNGEMVALCTSEEKPHCLGYGIVYCIDPTRRELFLLTPLSLSLMTKVRSLLLGAPSLTLPRKFLDSRCKELYEQRLPYTSTGEGQRTSQTTSRSFRQPAKFRQRTGAR